MGSSKNARCLIRCFPLASSGELKHARSVFIQSLKEAENEFERVHGTTGPKLLAPGHGIRQANIARGFPYIWLQFGSGGGEKDGCLGGVSHVVDVRSAFVAETRGSRRGGEAITWTKEILCGALEIDLLGEAYAYGSALASSSTGNNSEWTRVKEGMTEWCAS